MPLANEIVKRLAVSLDEAEVSRTQISQISRDHPDMTIDDAYAIQKAWVERKIARGRTVIGHKIGLTSRAMQRAVNITEPDFGVLLDDMLFETTQPIPCDRFIEPRVEVELAFVLRDALSGPRCTIFDVLDCTNYIIPAVEIIDARVCRTDPQTGVTRKVLDTIADNAANAGIVLGGRPVGPRDVDLRWVSALLSKNGFIEDTGVSAAVLNHPATGCAWLANRLSRFSVTLAPGEVLLSGSFTSPVFVSSGDTVHVDFGPLGAIGMQFR